MGKVEGLTVTGRIWSWLDNLSFFKKLPIVSEDDRPLFSRQNEHQVVQGFKDP